MNGTDTIRISVPAGMKAEIKAFAVDCCNGNVSRALVTLYRNRNAKHRLSQEAFGDVVEQRVRKVINENQ